MPHPFYGGQAWKQARTDALQRAKYRCQACGAKVYISRSSRVDHVIPREQRPDLALDPRNLRVLCIGCDALRHAEKGSGEAAGLWTDKRGTDARGLPTSPAHPWNRVRG